jgi:hypothetical protein
MVHKGLYRVKIYGCNRGGDGMAMCYDVWRMIGWWDDRSC